MASARVAAVRRFNRFYTRRIGLLGRGLLGSPLSLTQVRVLYELAHRDQPTAGAICRDLGLDAGYLSRQLQAFDKLGYVESRPSARDGREKLLSLTSRGRRAFAPLETRQDREVAAMLAKVGAADQRRLVDAMA